MAKVSLRIYNREIEALVDGGQLDEAIAHCRHILNTFPKHLETYRMIGKAYLEAKRYEEATDIFERVLMAVPDDFVAHVGMSIIRDEQKDMDAAIWHMQRAFEVQPSNAAIQAELQRLYGRRDGVEPPKIRLTRGALAHMYVQGELYPQAISEINAVLEEDRERQDMQVLLARAYYHAGQKSEAAEMCSQLLRRYPYCFDANRVLVELLPQTEQGESVQVYRKRINELNPYTAFVTGSVFNTEEVPDAAVNLEKLDWNGQPVDMGPEWGESEGIGLGEKPAAGNEEPDWLRTGLTSASFDASTPTASSSQEDEPASAPGGMPVPSAGGDDEIPEFLRAAGWGEDTGAFQEGLGSFDDSDESSEATPLAEGDLPDWVKAMAPAGADMQDETPQANSDEDLAQDDVPDWLQGLGDVQSTSSEEHPPTEAEVPDWLGSPEPTEDETPEPQPQEQIMAEPTDDNDIPDWLKDMQTEEEQSAPQETPQESAQEPTMMGDESLADWQIDDETAEPSAELDATDTGTLGTSAAEQDDAIAWLEGLASKHGAKPEELVTDPADRKETEPDWVQKAKATQEQAGVEEPVAQEQSPAEPAADLPDFLSEERARPVEETPAEPPADLPDFLAEEQAEPAEEPAAEVGITNVSELGTSAEEQDDAVAWLESLAAKHGAKPEELVTDPNARKETAPDWVQKATEAGSEHAIGERPTAPPSEDFGESDQEVQEVIGQEDESLYAEAEEAQTPEPTPPAAMDETGMWLQDLDEESGVPEEPEAAGEAELPAMEGDVPDWLREMETETSQTEAAPISQDEASLPDWLSDIDSEAAEAESVPAPSLEDETVSEAVYESHEKVDINSASMEQLAELPGIGDLLAQNIITYREAYGGFSSIDDLSNIAGIGPSVIEGLHNQIEVKEQPDITDWLRNVDAEADEASAETVQETSVDDLPSWLAGLEEETETAQPATNNEGDLPEWLRSETESETAQPEPTAATDWQPAGAERPAQEEPSASEPEAPPAQTAPPLEPEPEVEESPIQAAPASGPEVEEPLVQAAPPPAPAPEPELEPPAPAREPYREPVTRSRSGMTGMLSAAQDPALTEAQNELTRGNIPGAMESYGKLIKKGKMLDEIIFDLREALYRYPVEVNILQTLGDAYMRANRLQEALDSYTKAEKLLR